VAGLNEYDEFPASVKAGRSWTSWMTISCSSKGLYTCILRFYYVSNTRFYWNIFLESWDRMFEKADSETQ